MEPITLRGLTIGKGRPKIVVPLTGGDLPALLEEAEALKDTPAQMAEWRVDWYGESYNTSALLLAAPRLRAALGDIPLLATYRRREEGGRGENNLSRYAAILEALSLTGSVDMIDMELSAGDFFLRREVAFAHDHGVKVLLSFHDFDATPGMGSLFRKLGMMDTLGCDMGKLAVMPRSAEDVLTLLDVTSAFSETARMPIVTMSMGQLGVISRVTGQLFGSALTFATVGSASAPGQLTAAETAMLMEVLQPQRTVKVPEPEPEPEPVAEEKPRRRGKKPRPAPRRKRYRPSR